MMTPSEEGLRRYRDTGGYNVEDGEPGEPCTCKKTCHPRCGGECTCDACALRFEMFLEQEHGLYGEDAGSDDRYVLACEAYRELS